MSTRRRDVENQRDYKKGVQGGNSKYFNAIKDRGRRQMRVKDKEKNKCYTCSSYEHLKRDCPHRPKCDDTSTPARAKGVSVMKANAT